MSSDDLYRTDDEPAESRVLSVSELTGEIKGTLEGRFASVWVSGEISNFSRPQSGHCYLTLKDDAAQIRAVLWRTAAQRTRGSTCTTAWKSSARATRRLCAARQLPVGHPADRAQGTGGPGTGPAAAARTPGRGGTVRAGAKRPLPRFPRRIAFVTSPTGAAVRDFLEVLRRRWRDVHVLIVPVRVQGEGAAAEIAAGIELVNRLAEPVDVLVVGRGGGSLEDLWAFNEEIVVRAIHASRVPVVSAVGHEIDVTLSDLVADVRALTPSEAAERVVPAADELRDFLDRQHSDSPMPLRNRFANGTGSGRRVGRVPRVSPPAGARATARPPARRAAGSRGARHRSTAWKSRTPRCRPRPASSNRSARWRCWPGDIA